jgi:hypothetical protein
VFSASLTALAGLRLPDAQDSVGIGTFAAAGAGVAAFAALAAVVLLLLFKKKKSSPLPDDTVGTIDETITIPDDDANYASEYGLSDQPQDSGIEDSGDMPQAGSDASRDENDFDEASGQNPDNRSFGRDPDEQDSAAPS